MTHLLLLRLLQAEVDGGGEADPQAGGAGGGEGLGGQGEEGKGGQAAATDEGDNLEAQPVGEGSEGWKDRSIQAVSLLVVWGYPTIGLMVARISEVLISLYHQPAPATMVRRNSGSTFPSQHSSKPPP